MFHKVVLQHAQGVVGPIITTLRQITRESSSERVLKIGYDLAELRP